MKAKLYTLGVIFLLSTSLAAQPGGSCGANATWSFADSTLTISGTGALSSYYYPNKVPWDSLKNRIAVVNVCEGITSFANVSFSEYNSLMSFTVPSTVTTIESALLRSCASLTSIIVDPNNAVYDSRENCNAIIETATNKLVVGCKNSVIPTTVVSIGNSAFYRCFGLTNITIPNGVTSIGSTAFLDCTSLNAITIPNSVTTIGEQAFVNCSLITTIDIPNSVTSLGKKAFYHCSALTSATISDDITTIEANTFLECINLTSVTLGNNLTSIGEKAFNYCSKLPSIVFPNGLVSIGKQAFSRCVKLDSIAIPNSVTTIGEEAFGGCSALTAITLPDSMTNISAKLFTDCTNLTSVAIPNGVTSISNNAFRRCSSLTSVTFPNTLTYIGVDAFRDCINLGPITLPHSLTTIDKDAFTFCHSLSSLVIPSSVVSLQLFPLCQGFETLYFESPVPPTIQSGDLQILFVSTADNVPLSQIHIYYPCGADSAYQAVYLYYEELGDRLFPYPFSYYQFSCTSNNERIGNVDVIAPQSLCDSVTITATPIACNRFKKWSDGSTEPSRTLLLTQDTSLVAIFEAVERTVTAISSDESLGIVEGGGTYDCGTKVTLVAIPFKNCRFTRWKDGTQDNPRTITVAANCKFEAMFVKDDTAIDDVTESSSFRPQKLLENNQLYILLPNGARYTATGQLIK